MPGTGGLEQRVRSGAGRAPAREGAAASGRRARAGAVARVVLAWALGIVLLGWLTRAVEWQRVGPVFRGLPAWAWAAGVLGLAGTYVLRALRIHAELGRRHQATVLRCLEVMVLHNSAVNLLPLRGGEAAYPLLVNRRLGVPLAHATASLVWMRVQDAVVLALLAVALWPGISPLARAGVAGALVLAVALGLRLLERASASRADGGPRLLRVARGALRALALAPRHGAAGWVYCGASWTLKLVVLGGLLAALSGLPAAAGITGALGGELAGVLPLQGPANLGTYEAGVWLGASLRGSSPPEVVAAALAVHLLSLATAVAGGALGWALSPRRREPRDEVRTR